METAVVLGVVGLAMAYLAWRSVRTLRGRRSGGAGGGCGCGEPKGCGTPRR